MLGDSNVFFATIPIPKFTSYIKFICVPSHLVPLGGCTRCNRYESSHCVVLV